MNMPEEFTVPQAASYLNVSEETVRRNIRSKRLKALRRGTQWFIPCDVLVVFASSYDPEDRADTTVALVFGVHLREIGRLWIPKKHSRPEMDQHCNGGDNLNPGCSAHLSTH